MKLKQQQEGRKQDKALQYAKESNNQLAGKREKQMGAPSGGKEKRKPPQGERTISKMNH